VQAWGGSNILHDPELVDKLLTRLRVLLVGVKASTL
jgi:hypothetical protein